MKLKTLFAIGVAAAFAVPLSIQAQSDKPSSGTSGSASGSSTDVPAKCAALTGADREKCITDARASTGGSGGSMTGPSTSPSTSTSGSTGSEAPKKQ